MNKEKDDFFLHSNEVNHINREDYEKIELLVNAAVWIRMRESICRRSSP